MNVDELDKVLPFKKDAPKNHYSEVKHIPSIQNSSTGDRHSPDILGQLVGTKEKNMVVHEKKHSKTFLKDIAAAKNTIKEAEDNMKKMDSEVKDFHKHMALSMSKLMQTF